MCEKPNTSIILKWLFNSAQTEIESPTRKNESESEKDRNICTNIIKNVISEIPNYTTAGEEVWSGIL